MHACILALFGFSLVMIGAIGGMFLERYTNNPEAIAAYVAKQRARR